jgi:hypothetical protein
VHHAAGDEVVPARRGVDHRHPRDPGRAGDLDLSRGAADEVRRHDEPGALALEERPDVLGRRGERALADRQRMAQDRRQLGRGGEGRRELVQPRRELVLHALAQLRRVGERRLEVAQVVLPLAQPDGGVARRAALGPVGLPIGQSDPLVPDHALERDVPALAHPPAAMGVGEHKAHVVPAVGQLDDRRLEQPQERRVAQHEDDPHGAEITARGRTTNLRWRLGPRAA